MSRTSTLVTLLRVRRVQEDVARAAVVTAHAAAAQARQQLEVRNTILDNHRLPEGATGTAYVAAMAAARALAADASAARVIRNNRDDVVRRAVAHWAEASTRADAVDDAVTDEVDHDRAEAERREQSERDDTSAAAWLRRRELT